MPFTGPTGERVEDGEEEELGQQEDAEGEEGQGPGGAQQDREAQHGDGVPAGPGARRLLLRPQFAEDPQRPGQHHQVEKGREATIAHDQDTVHPGALHPAPAEEG